MTTFRSEDLFVGFVALALLPMIAWRIRRGLREGRLPVYRTYLTRDEGGSRFTALLAVHVVSFVVVALIAADLIFQLGLKEAL
jgi:predicted small integral membrane protein